jgi:hypothetical protein
LALALNERGDPTGALAQLENALAIVGADPGDDSLAAVQRCVLLNEIAMLQAQLGRLDTAVATLEAHVALLKRFRDRMVTRDPYVLRAAQRRIDGRKAELARLRGGRDAPSARSQAVETPPGHLRDP